MLHPCPDLVLVIQQASKLNWRLARRTLWSLSIALLMLAPPTSSASERFCVLHIPLVVRLVHGVWQISRRFPSTSKSSICLDPLRTLGVEDDEKRVRYIRCCAHNTTTAPASYNARHPVTRWSQAANWSLSNLPRRHQKHRVIPDRRRKTQSSMPTDSQIAYPPRSVVRR